MVKVREDLTGRQFGRLTVICQVEDHVGIDGVHVAKWRCECGCDAHNIVEVVGHSLKSGGTQSCGCLRNERVQKYAKNNKKYNQYNLSGEYGVGYCSNTGVEFYFDLEDYNKIKDYCWVEQVIANRYHKVVAFVSETKQTIAMHVLLGYKNYDHIDRNALNNRKCNLRPATSQENTRNRGISKRNKSGVIGVSWRKDRQKWRAAIGVDYKRISLGLFSEFEEAVKARLQAEQKYFGDFAPQNHLFEQYKINLKG